MPPPSIRTEARLAGARDQAFQHTLVEPLIAPFACAINHRTIQQVRGDIDIVIAGPDFPDILTRTAGDHGPREFIRP